MKFATQNDIQSAGFDGFVPVRNLQTPLQRQMIPQQRGLYMILRSTSSMPIFLANCSAFGRTMTKPPRPIADLQTKWQMTKASIVVYIGQAGGSGSCEGGFLSDSDLRKRLGQYMRVSDSHGGGRTIWQLTDSGDLLVCWKPVLTGDPKQIECALLREFSAIYGCYPLANWL